MNWRSVTLAHLYFLAVRGERDVFRDVRTADQGDRLVMRKMFGTAAVLMLALALPAMAKESPHRTVTATGDFKDQRITAPVRKAEAGEEVLIPGGSWTDCADDCEKTLKNSTYDFWTNLEEEEN